MPNELILCIPGPWTNRADFLTRIISAKPAGRYMFAGGLLVDVERKDHVEIECCGQDERMTEAFGHAGQGMIPEECLEEISKHTSVAYLHFPLDLPAQRERLARFTAALRNAGGLAIKLESSGIAHTWERWERLLGGSPFDLYCCAVVLVGGSHSFSSCGMHHFGLPECEVPSYMGPSAGANLMNRFNVWRITERPELRSGETLSLITDEPPFKLELVPDGQHEEDSLFHNPHGVWRLTRASSVAPVNNQWKKPEDEPLFVAVSSKSGSMQEAFAKARQTLPRFLEAIDSKRFSRATNSVKLRLRDEKQSAELGEDRYTFLWLWDVRSDTATRLSATVQELPKEGLNQLRVGETVPFAHDDVCDWMIVEGSQAWGGFTLRVIRDGMTTQERLQYDDYTGILCYNELE